MITLDPTISFSLGAIVGALATKLLDIIVSNSRDARNRGIQLRNTAGEEFRNVLLASINKIEDGKHRREVINEDFTTHRESFLRFSHCIKGGAKRRLEEDWNKYQEWYQDICCRDAAKRIYPPEGEKEFNRKCEIDATEFIRKLVIHSSPK